MVDVGVSSAQGGLVDGWVLHQVVLLADAVAVVAIDDD